MSMAFSEHTELVYWQVFRSRNMQKNSSFIEILLPLADEDA